MTVFVDNFRAPARVRGISGRWSHLGAITAARRAEMRAAAAKINTSGEVSNA